MNEKIEELGVGNLLKDGELVASGLSRRDDVMVAWHEVPGKAKP
jgi:hypothetical protein